MVSGGSSVSQWRVIAYLREYISRTAPIATTFQRGLPPFLKKFADSVQYPTKIRSLSREKQLHDVAGVPAAKKPDGVSDNLSELQKALKVVDAYFPIYFPQAYQNLSKEEQSKVIKENIPKWRTRKITVSKASINARTRSLVVGLGDNLTEGGRLQRLQNLCTHLRHHPQTKGVAVKEGGIRHLLKLIEVTKEKEVKEGVREALALLGYTPPVKGRGIKLLTIDGGGVRGLVALEILKTIEAAAGRPVSELFDMICGVSTGAVLAVLIGIHRKPLDECEKLYKELSTRIFTQTTFKGATSLFMSNSYYDSHSWSKMLKENLGEMCLIETAREEGVPKVCLVATSANANRVQAYLFRNYNLPYRASSHYPGTSLPNLWEAVRASAAAPGYFSEFRIGDNILLDGGVFVNNPSAIALHEAKQVWGDTMLQCLVSVGTGRREPIATTTTGTSISWIKHFRTIVNSATDTESVHTTLHDLLPGNVYYRFNPYLSEEINLDEISSHRLAVMMEDTELYLRKNEFKIQEAVKALNKNKSSLDCIRDWYQYQQQLWLRF